MTWANEQIKKDRDCSHVTRESVTRDLVNALGPLAEIVRNAGGMESSSAASSARISLIGAHSGGPEESEEFFEASA